MIESFIELRCRTWLVEGIPDRMMRDMQILRRSSQVVQPVIRLEGIEISELSRIQHAARILSELHTKSVLDRLYTPQLNPDALPSDMFKLNIT